MQMFILMLKCLQPLQVCLCNVFPLAAVPLVPLPDPRLVSGGAAQLKIKFLDPWW